MAIAILLHLRGGPWHGHTRWPYKLVPGIKTGNMYGHVIHKGDHVGYHTPFPPSEYTPRGKFPTKFHAGGGELNTCFFPKRPHQWGDSYLWCLPHWPLPPSTTRGFPNPLQGAGIMHDPSSRNCAIIILYTVSIVPSSTSRV